jgi:hypothetical protein
LWGLTATPLAPRPAQKSRKQRVNLAQLIEASEVRLLDIARHGSTIETGVARRLLEDAVLYHQWESEHDHLMRGVADVRTAVEQWRAARRASLGLIHRKALFEFVRDDKVVGADREHLFAQKYRQHSYQVAVAAEYANYLRAAASFFCLNYIGAWLLEDPVFQDARLAEYENVYHGYVRLRAGLNGHRRADVQFVRWRLGQIARALLEERSNGLGASSDEAHSVILNEIHVATAGEASEGRDCVVIPKR